MWHVWLILYNGEHEDDGLVEDETVQRIEHGWDRLIDLPDLVIDEFQLAHHSGFTRFWIAQKET